jgi:aspartate carbamoyltransferase catalytic subunit
MMSIQLKNNKLIHLLNLNSLNKEQILDIILTANSLIDYKGNLKKSKALDDRSIANLFFEPSTRTRNTFEIAAKRSSAKVINVDIENSATKKNESVLDTMRTLEAMQIDIFVIRHCQDNMAEFVASNLQNVAVINAGGGVGEHPTQGLLDILTIYRHKPNFADLTITIVGDIKNSRVAHSGIYGLTKLGVKNIRLVAPEALSYKCDNCVNYTNTDEAITNADVVMTLRLQKERMLEAQIPDETQYFEHYGITEKRMGLAKQDAILMHPGPINRGIEIENSVADGPNSVILEQVRNGIALRMAVMHLLIKNRFDAAQ